MNKEYEFKFNANDIKLSDFHKVAKTLNPLRHLEVSSWDTYYINKESNFIRYRNSKEKPELTIKRKTTESNNQDRIEINLPLRPSDESLVESFVALEGYKQNFKIFKYCFIYYYQNVDIVYYIVYDPELKEQARYLEIEFLEDKVNNFTTEQVFGILKEYEQKLSSLGITPQGRMKKSLFELYKNETPSRNSK